MSWRESIFHGGIGVFITEHEIEVAHLPVNQPRSSIPNFIIDLNFPATAIDEL